MTLQSLVTALDRQPARLLDQLQPLLAFGLRAWVGWQFFKSGLAKLSDWSATQFLFEEEYQVPLVSPTLAAVSGTAAEIMLPLLLWIGFATRLSALGLSAVNALAVVAYAHVLLQPGFEAAFGQHVLWGLMLVVVAVYGPGRLSADALLGHARRTTGSAGAVAGRT